MMCSIREMEQHGKNKINSGMYSCTNSFKDYFFFVVVEGIITSEASDLFYFLYYNGHVFCTI